MTAEEVRALPVGMTIKAIKEGHEPVICTVAFHDTVKNKFLTYRDKGQLKSFAIKDYPGMTYQK